MTGRMEVVGRMSGRRRWSDAEKLEILAEAFRPGIRVCDVIARREVSSSLIYTWRKQLREGKLAGAVPSLPAFAAVQVAEPTPPAPEPVPCSSRLIQIELPGGVRVEIDNNIAERALRGVAVGRRNWLFAGSRAGGERAAAIYTVIQTCKANGIDPQAYITDVIAKVAGDWPASRWDELMPWNWMPPVDQPTAQAA